MKDPETDEEWQNALDAADAMIHLDSARKYGLITGGPETINVERCEQIMREALSRGFRCRPGNVERMINELNKEPENA